MISDDDSAFKRNVYNLFAPIMAEYLLYIVTLLRIYVQYPFKQVFELVAYCGGQDVLAR